MSTIVVSYTVVKYYSLLLSELYTALGHHTWLVHCLLVLDVKRGKETLFSSSEKQSDRPTTELTQKKMRLALLVQTHIRHS